MKKPVSKFFVLTCSLLLFIGGWKVSVWYNNSFEFWLSGPPPAEYLGINIEKRMFNFQLSYTGGITERPFSSLGADEETAHIVDALLQRNKYNLCASTMESFPNEINLYLLGDPSTPPIPLHKLLPKLFGTQHSMRKNEFYGRDINYV